MHGEVILTTAVSRVAAEPETPETTRWRLTRPAQRRVPAAKTTLTLGAPGETNNTIQAVQAGGQGAADAINTALASYTNILSGATALRR